MIRIVRQQRRTCEACNGQHERLVWLAIGRGGKTLSLCPQCWQALVAAVTRVERERDLDSLEVW